MFIFTLLFLQMILLCANIAKVEFDEMIFIHRFHGCFMLWDCTYIATFTWWSMSVCITVKNCFWCSSNHTLQVCTQHKNRFLFCSLLICVPYKQYFALKVLSLCKTVKPHSFLCSFAIPFKFSAVLFLVPHKQDYLMMTPLSCLLLTLISPLNSHAPLSRKSLWDGRKAVFLCLSLTFC